MKSAVSLTKRSGMLWYLPCVSSATFWSTAIMEFTYCFSTSACIMLSDTLPVLLKAWVLLMRSINALNSAVVMSCGFLLIRALAFSCSFPLWLVTASSSVTSSSTVAFFTQTSEPNSSLKNPM